MAKGKHFYIRKSHRYLGLLLGVQFLLWTISGLYFSWTNIDEIHGDFERRPVPQVNGAIALVSPSAILQQAHLQADSLQSLQLVNILGQPHYQLQYFTGGTHHTTLANAATGAIRQPITRSEAVQIAAESFAAPPAVKSVTYLTGTNGHHEYREKPLPAWAVTFVHPTHTTVYVSALGGKVESFRNNKWRVFDFLWMGHTMDYQSRDNINNWLLRIFSLFGLITVMSGFVLYAISSRSFKKKRKPQHSLSALQG